MKPPRFVVYHIRSTMEKKTFFHRHHAVALVDKLNEQEARYNDHPGPDYAFTSVEHYRTGVVHMVTRINMMTGAEYQEPSNTPSYCSPASEAYWSM